MTSPGPFSIGLVSAGPPPGWYRDPGPIRHSLNRHKRRNAFHLMYLRRFRVATTTTGHTALTFEMSANTGKDRIQRKDELLEARPITITLRVSDKSVVNDLQSGVY
ncbi:hypothetical protein [Mycobacterium senriense]|uniref:Uncharacterized protein n=1 Tax=Mycobacterium senriense TaxID=2775496 RepID=A0ABN6ICI5_9MYCO|nr:hypothetical protein [Mycobacterium senriense]BCZ20751.1 hypothetical protein MTY59_06060 [Mycobacterium senriense]